MAKVTEGTIEAVSREKKFGTYGFKLDGEWYNTPKLTDAIDKGNTVMVKFDKVKGRNKVSGFKLVSEGSGDSGGYSRSSGGGSRREMVIQYQHSQEMGIQATALLLENGAEKLPAAKDPQGRKAVILSMIDEYTAKYYNAIAGQDALSAEAEVEEDLDDDEEDFDDSTDDDDGDVDWED